MNRLSITIVVTNQTVASGCRHTLNHAPVAGSRTLIGTIERWFRHKQNARRLARPANVKSRDGLTQASIIMQPPKILHINTYNNVHFCT